MAIESTGPQKAGKVVVIDCLSAIGTPAKARWWVSWYGKHGTFELHSPWWNSGTRQASIGGGEWDDIFYAAVLANSEDEALKVILDAHDNAGAGIVEWRFAHPRPVDWSPFGDRFPRVDWMQWPEEKR